MLSRPKKKEERAKGEAREDADEIKAAREGRESLHHQQLRREDYQADSGNNKPGIISSVFGAFGSTYEHAKEVVTGKSHDAAETTKETAESASRSLAESRDAAAERARVADEQAKEGRDNAAERLRESKDYAADKAVAAKDTTVDTAKAAKDKTAGAAIGGKDYVADKAKGAADYTAEKAKEGKDSAVGKLGDLKDSAADVAKKAMDFLSGKKEETKEKVGETAEAAKEKTKEAAEAAKDKTWETKEEAKRHGQDIYKGTEEEERRKMEEMRIEKLREKGYDIQVDDEATERARPRGDAGKANILGTIGNVAESIKSKLTMTSDIVEDKSRDKGGKGGGEGRTVVVSVEETPPGAAADLGKMP